MKTVILRTLATLLLAVLSATQATASVQYQWVFSSSGDTVGTDYLADNGDLVLGGFGDVCGGGKSAIRVYDAATGLYGSREFVTGLPRGTPESPDCGVHVSKRNSAGDMVGHSTVNGLIVPTFWQGGVAFDLNDPLNAGLVFVPDAGVVLAQGPSAMDLSGLDIIAPHSQIRSGTDFYLRSLYTNALGMIAAESSLFNNLGFVLIPLVSVPEPASVWLVLGAALAAAAACRRSNRARRG